MMYPAIEEHEGLWPVRMQCEVLQVSASGYYDWKKREASMRVAANENLIGHIRRIFWDSHK